MILLIIIVSIICLAAKRFAKMYLLYTMALNEHCGCWLITKLMLSFITLADHAC